MVKFALDDDGVTYVRFLLCCKLGIVLQKRPSKLLVVPAARILLLPTDIEVKWNLGNQLAHPVNTERTLLVEFLANGVSTLSDVLFLGGQSCLRHRPQLAGLVRGVIQRNHK